MCVGHSFIEEHGNLTEYMDPHKEYFTFLAAASSSVIFRFPPGFASVLVAGLLVVSSSSSSIRVGNTAGSAGKTSSS